MIYPYRCTECEVVVEIERSVHAPSDPPGPDIKCMCESSKWKRIYEMPGTQKESYLDGQRKFTEFREASKLQREANRSASQQKKDEIAKEIKRIGVRLT
jgi:hypothetical protein